MTIHTQADKPELVPAEDVMELKDSRGSLVLIVQWFDRALQKPWIRDLPNFSLYVSMREETAALLDGAPLTEYGFLMAQAALGCFYLQRIEGLSVTKPPLRRRSCREEARRAVRKAEMQDVLKEIQARRAARV